MLPHIDYCNIIWGRVQYAVCNITRVQNLQDRYARLILNADLSTCHILMSFELSWQSVCQKIKYLACLYKLSKMIYSCLFN